MFLGPEREAKIAALTYAAVWRTVSLKADVHCPSTYTPQGHILKVLLQFEKVLPSAVIIIKFDWKFPLHLLPFPRAFPKDFPHTAKLSF